jgi:hypothetical protein
MITAMIMLLPLSRFFLSFKLFNTLVKEIPQAQPKQELPFKNSFLVNIFLGSIYSMLLLYPNG